MGPCWPLLSSSLHNVVRSRIIGMVNTLALTFSGFAVVPYLEMALIFLDICLRTGFAMLLLA